MTPNDKSRNNPARCFPYASLAARFTDPTDRDRFATVSLGNRQRSPMVAFHAIARRTRSLVTEARTD